MRPTLWSAMSVSILQERDMGIFDSIRDTIFGKANAAPVPPTTRTSTTAPQTSPAPETRTAPSSQAVDVSAVLEKAVAAKKRKLNWRTSIVDLMKALDLDSGLGARKKLAEIGRAHV